MAFESLTSYPNTASQRADCAQSELELELELERVVDAALSEMHTVLPHIERINGSSMSPCATTYSELPPVDFSPPTPTTNFQSVPSPPSPHRIINVPAEDDCVIETSEDFWFPLLEFMEESQRIGAAAQVPHTPPISIQPPAASSVPVNTPRSDFSTHHNHPEYFDDDDVSYSNTPFHIEPASPDDTASSIIQTPNPPVTLSLTVQHAEVIAPLHHPYVAGHHTTVSAGHTISISSPGPSQSMTLRWQTPIFGADITNTLGSQNASGSTRTREEDNQMQDRPLKRRKVMHEINASVATWNSENVAPATENTAQFSTPGSSSASWPWQYGVGCDIKGSNCAVVKPSPNEMVNHLREVHRITKGNASKLVRDENGRKTEEKARTSCQWKGCSESLAYSSVAKHLKRFHIGSTGWVCGHCKVTVNEGDKRAHERICSL